MEQSTSGTEPTPEKESRITCCYLTCCLIMSLLTLAACMGLIFGILYMVDKQIFFHQASSKAQEASQEPFVDLEANLPLCPKKSDSVIAEKIITCEKSTFNQINTAIFEPKIQDEDEIGKLGHWEGGKPLRYDLNLTFEESGLEFSGRVSMLLVAMELVSRILINMDTEALISPHLDQKGIVVRKRCSLEIICIKKITVLPKLQVLVLEPETPIEKGEHFTVFITHFAGSIYDDFSGKGSKGTFWANNMGDDLAVGTIFQMRYARTIFPCLDHPSLKAKFHLCVQHSPDHRALSNTDLENMTALEKQETLLSCFEKTPVLPTYVFTFSVVSKLDVLTNQTKEVRIDVYGPKGESETLEWIIPETLLIMQRLEDMSNRKYGLPKLGFLNVDPTPFWGIENYGLVTMDYGWTSYPRYEKPHQILVHEIIHQWIGDLFTIRSWSEICLQEGLTSFFEWSLSSQLESIDLDFNETVSHAVLAGLSLDDGKHPIIRSDFEKTKDIQDRCFGKPPIAFSMLTQIFGQDIIAEFLSEMTTLFSYRNAGLKEWVAVLSKVAKSKIAGKLLKNFFQTPGYPIIFAMNTSNTEVTIIQKVFSDGKIQEISSVNEAFVLPLTVKSSAEEEKQGLHFQQPIIGLETKISLLKPFQWFILDPQVITYSRPIYTAENYLQIVQCYKKHGKFCHLSKDEIQKVFLHFCFVLLKDQLPLSEDESNVGVWRELKTEINDLRPGLTLDYPCKCCFMTETEIQNDHGGFFQGCKDGYKQHCESLKIMQILK